MKRMAKPNEPSDPLLDHIAFIGPAIFASEDKKKDASSVNILASLPRSPQSNCLPLSAEIACFCQPSPEKSRHLGKQPRDHIFMLTDKETDIKRYGICITFLCESPVKTVQEDSLSFEAADAQVISVAIISRFMYFNFFRKCLHELYGFVEDFGAGSITWWDLIYEGESPSGASGNPLVGDIIAWLERLLSMSPPEEGHMLEVELSVAPPFKLFCPPSRRFPIADYPIHDIFDRFSIDNALLIFKLLMCEEKVLIHSTQYWAIPQVVLSFIALMYPFSYLYPTIPLLPKTLPDTENLLLVPTPYFIGVETSFLDRLEEHHMADLWLVNMDEDRITPPDGCQEIPDYPNSEIEVHSDLQQALKKADGLKGCGETMDSIDDILDTEIRTAFVEFLLCRNMLGLLTTHMYIIRLFPRPTVSLKSHAFSSDYHKVVSEDSSSPDFVGRIIASQCVRNFLEWTLNPDNIAFLEITAKGVASPHHVGSRLSLIADHEHFKVHQISICPQDPSSALYRAMLKETTDGMSGESITSDDDSWVYVPMPTNSQKSLNSPDGHVVNLEMKPFVSTQHTEINVGKKSSDSKNVNNLLENVTPGGFPSNSPDDPTQLPSSWSPPSLPDKSIMCGSFTLQPGYQISPVPWTSSNSPNSSPTISRRAATTNVKESQCLELVHRVAEGQGLPWIKGQLENLVSREEARVTILETLQDQLEVKVVRDEPLGGHLCELSQIGVPKVVFHGVCELFKYLWKGAIKQFSTSPDCKMKSMFLLLRLSCYIYLDEQATRKKLTRTPSVRVKRSSSSNLQNAQLPMKGVESPTADLPKLLLHSPTSEEGVLLPFPDMSPCEGEGQSEEGGGFFLPRGRRLEDLKMGRETIRRYAQIKKQHGTLKETILEKSMPESSTLSTNVEERLTTSLPPSAVTTTSTPLRENNPSKEEAFSTPNEDFFYTPLGKPLAGNEDTDGAGLSRIKRPSPEQQDGPKGSKGSLQRNESQESLEGIRILNLKGIGDPKIQDSTVMSKLSHVLLIPHKWTQHYWNNMVWSLITFERDRLCWNEATAELSKKFQSLGADAQKQLIDEEDQIISSVVINVTLYMAATGMPAEEVRENLYRYVAKTRVNDSEGSMLHSLMKEFIAVEESCAPLLKKFSLLPLYSEATPTLTFVVHKGANRKGQVLKLVFTSSSCSVCHFPESYVLIRLWYDSIELLTVSPEQETVTLFHKEVNGVSRQYEFCTQQFAEVHTAFKKWGL